MILKYIGEKRKQIMDDNAYKRLEIKYSSPLRLYFVLEKIMDIYAKFECAKICRIYIKKRKV